MCFIQECDWCQSFQLVTPVRCLLFHSVFFVYCALLLRKKKVRLHFVEKKRRSCHSRRKNNQFMVQAKIEWCFFHSIFFAPAFYPPRLKCIPTVSLVVGDACRFESRFVGASKHKFNKKYVTVYSCAARAFVQLNNTREKIINFTINTKQTESALQALWKLYSNHFDCKCSVLLFCSQNRALFLCLFIA